MTADTWSGFRGNKAPPGMRFFPAAVQRLLRCDTPRRTREIQQRCRQTRGSILPQEQPLKVGPETALKCVRRPIGEMLYNVDAWIGLRSPRGLGRMVAIFVGVFGTFSLVIYPQSRPFIHSSIAASLLLLRLADEILATLLERQ